MPFASRMRAIRRSRVPIRAETIAAWVAARRYGLPAGMVAAATERRLVGDWRGACAAARFDVAVDPDLVDRRIAEDLAHFVPDLVRWNLPRDEVNGIGVCRSKVRMRLARYGDLELSVETGRVRSQRPMLRLHVVWQERLHYRVEDWSDARAAWDDRADEVHTFPQFRPWDDELFRRGLMVPENVHPRARTIEAGGYRPIDPPEIAPLSVSCGGQWHPLDWSGGRLTAPSHDDYQIRRERALVALGGTAHGCFATLSAWHRGTGWLPKVLRQLRSHVLKVVEHGDGEEFARLLDEGVGLSRIRDRDGNGLLHLAGRLDDAALVPRLVAAGLDVNERDKKGRTPLACAVSDGACAAVVRALLDAGADPRVVDHQRCGPLHDIGCADPVVVRWLIEAGADPHAPDSTNRTPLRHAVRSATPEIVLALLAIDAATDHPAAMFTADERSDARHHRPDLPFLH